MGMTLAEKIIASHLIEGRMEPGSEIAIRADQWLSHDMNAPMGFLGFETLGIPRVRVPLAVLYTDHNLVQVDYKTPDDFAYLQSIAKNTVSISPVRATASAISPTRIASPFPVRS